MVIIRIDILNQRKISRDRLIKRGYIEKGTYLRREEAPLKIALFFSRKFVISRLPMQIELCISVVDNYDKMATVNMTV